MHRTLVGRVLLATPLVLLLVSSSWSQQGERKPTTASWKAKLLSVTNPSKVSIARRHPFGGTEPAAAEAAPVGTRWLVISVKLTAPSDDASLEPQAIKVIDNTGAGHAALAMSSISESGKAPDYLYFKDSEGLGQSSKWGTLLWMFGYGKLRFLTTAPQRVSLLFSPPSATKPVSLVVGDSGDVPLTQRK